MRTKIRKWFWAWDFDKEEKWLNEMAAKGLSLVSVGYCTYIFEDTQPGEYTVRLELLDNIPTHPESRKYIDFVEDTGAEYIGSVLCWVYFRKEKDKGQFDLYSDCASKAKHLERILYLLGILGGLELLCGGYNILIYFTLDHGLKINLYMGILVLLLELLIGYGFLRIYRLRQKVKKEQRLYE